MRSRAFTTVMRIDGLVAEGRTFSFYPRDRAWFGLFSGFGTPDEQGPYRAEAAPSMPSSAPCCCRHCVFVA